MENKITIVMPYYENGNMLLHHLNEWNHYDENIKSHINVIIIDDGSKNKPAYNYLKDKNINMNIQLFRIKQDIPWNQHGAKNLGMYHCKGLCLMTDMDHLLLKEDAKIILNNIWDKHIVYKPRRFKISREGYYEYKRHPNTFLIDNDIFWKVGGYDEAFSGYYGTDSVFRKSIQKVSNIKETNLFKMILFGREDIFDASTNPEHYGRKNTKYHVSNNPELSKRKLECPKPIKPLNFDWVKVM